MPKGYNSINDIKINDLELGMCPVCNRRLTAECEHRDENSEEWYAAYLIVEQQMANDKLPSKITDSRSPAETRDEIDPRIKQQSDILCALENEPVAKEQADALVDELAELEADLQRKPPEVVEFGSAKWFDGIEEIEF